MIYNARPLRTQYQLSSNISSSYPTFIFITKEIDFSEVDWSTYATHLNDLSTTVGAGSIFSHLGLNAENIYGVYAPAEYVIGTTRNTTSGSEARTEYTCATASSALTFTSKLDAAPVQCLILVQTSGGVSQLPNNATPDQVLTASAQMNHSSIISASVGLRDSDAEVILLADEFKKGSEYRISDFSFAFNWYKD